MSREETLKAHLWDFLVDDYIATEDEIRLVVDINGYTKETFFDILYARTGCRTIEQAIDDNYPVDDWLKEYYDLTDDEDGEEWHS